jgi:transposase
VQITFPERTLKAEQQAVVDLTNRLLVAYPDHQDDSEVLRLAAYLLELADVAPQAEIAKTLGYKSDRTIRNIRDRVEREGLDALIYRVTGRPPVTTRPEVIEATLEEILNAVIDEHDLPEDEELAKRINQRLGKTDYNGEPVTARIVQTIRLRKDIERVATKQALSSIAGQNEPEEATETASGGFSLGHSRWGGAFAILALLVREAWLKAAEMLTIASDYAITPEQLLLTAIFAPICGISRAFHLDDVRDVGFALLTGRSRPLTHGPFQHLIHALSLRDVVRFYRATSQQQVERVEEEDLRVSMDGHTVARFTKLVDLPKGRMGSSKRIEKVDNVITSFALDLRSFLALRIRRGAKQLHRAVIPMVREILRQWESKEGTLRLFLDRGAFHGLLFQALKALPRVHFYIPAVRYPNYVEAWEELPDSIFEENPFVFERDKDLPPEERVSYRLADTIQEVNLWKDGELLGTVTLRAIILFNPEGETTSERWFVLLTDDEDTPARKLANEYGDHWEHEMAHRGGKHDLCYDILPPSYTIETHHNEDGELIRETELNIKNCFLMSWLRCLTFNLMTHFGEALGGKYAKMRVGTLLRKFIHRPAQLFVIGDELHIVFDPFKDQEALRPLLDELNQERIAVPWLNGLVLQFFIDEERDLHPLTGSEKRKWFLNRGKPKCTL